MTIQCSDFVISFIDYLERDKGKYYYPIEEHFWKNDRQFSMDEPLSGLRLSLFQFFSVGPVFSGVSRNRLYRLWCRRVVNENEDSTILSLLRGKMNWWETAVHYDYESFDTITEG